MLRRRTFAAAGMLIAALLIALLVAMTTCPSTAASPSPAERRPGTAVAPQSTPAAAPPVRPVRPPPPAREPGKLYNGTFVEQVDGTPRGWTAFGPAPKVEVAAGGTTAVRVVTGPAGISWLAQSIRIQGGTAFEVRARAAGDARAALRISWHATDDGSGDALGFVEAGSSEDGADRGSMASLSTGPFVTAREARSLRVRLVAEGSPGASALFADVALASVPLPAAVGPVATAPASAAVTPTEPTPAAVVAAPARPAPGVVVAPPAARGEAAPMASAATAEAIAPTAALADAASTPQAVPLRPRASGVPTLKINEIGFGRRGTAWIEIYNAGNAAVGLDGWTLAGEDLPALVLPGHGYVVVAAGEAFLDDFPRFSSALVFLAGGAATGLRHEADHLELADPGGLVVDAVSWGADVSALRQPLPTIAPGHSLERRIAGLDRDLQEDFVDNARPTPGEGYAADAASRDRADRRAAALLGAALAVPLTLLMAGSATLARRRLASKA